ncbi:MAG: adenylyltransferase/cytidyltransferase family protein [Elusimicrobiota bacterium]|jgi:rfaE bifunctional protein nucleotidyltransferase chain/domain|nr:adenylyltransferase/cytidyltransferase family protein [Elusimicrobiota bacterium]
MKYIKRALSVKEINSLCKKLKKDGKKIVFTNGCFDLLHLGHISLFEKAKSLGDILIAAINSDKSLKKLKGPKRPLVCEKDRAKILLALKSIDFVVVFGEQTPYNLLKLLRPDILVKGGDYKTEDIIGREFVRQVYRFPFIKGHSTTNLINLIVKRYGKNKKPNVETRYTRVSRMRK